MAFYSCGCCQRSLATAVLLGLVPGVLLLSAQEPLPALQFNVPYRCADGTAYVIQRCEPVRNGEVCYFRIEKNGQLLKEAYNVRSQMTGIVKTCPVQASSQAGPPLNPPYLREMPSVEQVKSQIQARNPIEAIARQMAVFRMLEQIVYGMQGPNRSRNALKPDELQVIHAYEAAASDMLQSYTKTHSPEQLKAFNQLQSGFDGNPALYQEMLDKLLAPAIRAEYAKANPGFEARNEARAQADQRDAGSLRTQPGAAQAGSPFIRNDPGTLAARRCVELGGSDMDCIGKGLKSAVGDLFGGFVDQITGKTSTSMRTGLVMTGRYQGENSLNLSFGDEAAALNGCGKLVPNSHAYSVVRNGSRFTITVQAKPKPFALSLGADGRLIGPGLTDIAGQIITGYNRVFMQEYRNGIPLAGGACGGPCGYWASEPIYADKTERCGIGALLAAGPTGTAGSLINAAIDMVAGQSSPASQKNLPAPGVRIVGQYSGQGGLTLDFQTEAVTLDCGPAHVIKPYAVENGASEVLVTVKKDASPFTLAVRPDGTLTGSGSVEVVGRVVTGSSGNGIDFAPRRQVCPIGVLAPNSGGAAAPTADRASSPGTTTSTVGNAVLSLATAGFPVQPGHPSPLNGLTMYLLKESFADVLSKNGIRPAAGMSVIQAWGAACDRQAPECAQALNAVKSYVAGTVKLDMEGKASFPGMPSGTYHVFGWMGYSGHHLVWDLQVDLKPGANGVVLDQRNAIPLN